MKLFICSPSSLLLGVLLALWPTYISAIFKEDAGVFDFRIQTTGHSLTEYVYTSGDLVVTSDSISASAVAASSSSCSTSCYVACRNINDGNILWRHNVCSSSFVSTGDGNSCHVVTSSNDVVYTMDKSGIVRAWELRTGVLLWDTLTYPATVSTLRLWKVGGNVIGSISDDENLYLLDVVSGKIISTINAATALAHANIDKGNNNEGTVTARWLEELSTTTTSSDGIFQVLVGWVTTTANGEDVTTASKISVALLDTSNAKEITMSHTTPLVHQDSTATVTTPLSVSTLRVQPTSIKGWKLLALTPDSKQMLQLSIDSQSISSSSQLYPAWTSIMRVLPSSDAGIIRILGHEENDENSMALFHLENDGVTWRKWGDDTKSNAIAFCPAAGLMVSVVQQQIQVSRVESVADSSQRVLSVTGDNTISNVLETDTITGFTFLSCDDSTTYSLLLTTAAGTTAQITLSFTDNTNDTINSKIGWAIEEGLGQISKGIMLDSSHLHVEDLSGEDEEQVVKQRLQFSSRLVSQWNGIVGTVTSLFSIMNNNEAQDDIAATSMGIAEVDHRHDTFGFNKVAVLLSEKVHRVYGIATHGKYRGLPARYVIDLPKEAMWHKLVHGTTNSNKNVHGINGGTHTNDVLIVSSSSSSVQYICFAGTNGMIHTQGSISNNSPVIQIVPLVGEASTTACKQRAILVHEDHSISLVPSSDTNADEGIAMLKNYIHSTKNGMYTHYINRKKSAIETYQINSNLGTSLVGKTSFKGEKIVKVTYPNRDEMVQSRCTVLGDESLLLKYLNPHLAVVITVRETDEVDPFASVFKNDQSNNNKQRKPMGVTQPGGKEEESIQNQDATTTDDVPNLFVNVIDTVSGRILHRVSHMNVKVSPRSMTDEKDDDIINALISENWIFYTFVNYKTRKTELGVITLYEGMIHPKGLTAFTSPEQNTIFSSLDARESKPVVVAATYSLPKPATSLGVTTTRAGISPHQLIISTADDRIFAIERRIVEPRRPIGEVKESEKKEGLHQYSELIPFISFQSISYNQTIENVKTIISTSTDLESQSLVLAFGGPDIFFTRTSPSKGFDLLPDSFNKPLLSMVVIILLTVLGILNSMSSTKMIKQGWK